MRVSKLKSGMICRASDTEGGSFLGIWISGTLITSKNGGVDYSMFKEYGGSYKLLEVYEAIEVKRELNADFDFWFGEGEYILEHCNLIWDKDDAKIEVDGKVYTKHDIRKLLKI